MTPYRQVAFESSSRASSLCLAVGGTVLGLAMIAAGPDRFVAPGFATARLVPGGVFTWGAVLVVAGAVSLVGITRHWSRRVVMLGMVLEGCWFAFFAVALGVTTHNDPKGAVTGPVAYGVLSILCAVGLDTGRGLRR